MDLPKYYLSRSHMATPPANYRPMSAFPKSWSVIKTEFNRENHSFLYELMFKHGRQLEQFPFSFPRPPRLQFDHERSSLSNAWRCENKAFRQMHCMSARTPRRRVMESQIYLETDARRQAFFDSENRRTSHNRITSIQRTKSAPPRMSRTVWKVPTASDQS